jgi:hypothetical protein
MKFKIGRDVDGGMQLESEGWRGDGRREGMQDEIEGRREG